MPQHPIPISSIFSARGVRALVAGLFIALGMLAFLPAVAPLEGIVGDAGQRVIAAARRDHSQQSAANLPSFADRSVRALCGDGLDGFRSEGMPLCTHGNDAPPPGYRAAPAEPVRITNQATLALPCIDDGKSGPRVQVLYVYSGVSRYADFLDSMRLWVSDMNQIFEESAQQTGGHRQIRVVTTRDCLADIIPVEVAASDLESFGGSIDAVAQGLDALPDPAQHFSYDRNYLMFADADVYCGIGTVRPDDRPTTDNINNKGGSFARADTRCWTGMVIAHEVMHNLGGVQLSAPNSSGGWHCIDERDVMCYSDSPYHPALVNRCTTGVWATTNLFDCNHDDYFSTAAPGCSYLGQHWNTSASSFLHDPTGAYQTTSDDPCMTLSAATVPVGGGLKITAASFVAGELVSVSIGGKAVGTFRVSGIGAGEFNAIVPALPGGARTVLVSGSSASRQGTITITSSMTVKSGALNTGKRERVELTGFGAGEAISLKLGAKIIARGVADANGSASIRFTLDDGFRSGQMVLQATGVRGSRASRQVDVAATGKVTRDLVSRHRHSDQAPPAR